MERTMSRKQIDKIKLDLMYLDESIMHMDDSLKQLTEELRLMKAVSSGLTDIVDEIDRPTDDHRIKDASPCPECTSTLYRTIKAAGSDDYYTEWECDECGFVTSS